MAALVAATIGPVYKNTGESGLTELIESVPTSTPEPTATPSWCTNRWVDPAGQGILSLTQSNILFNYLDDDL